jgi:galactokinase
MYPLAVVEALEKTGPLPDGFELTYVATLPAGMGLSSSASLEVGTGLALAALSGRTIDPKALALLCQEAETRASGVRVGAMDPLAIALGQRGNALLIDCTDLSVKPVPLPLAEYAVVVCDSGRPRSLASGAYNARREESEEALAALGRATGIEFVARALTPEVLHKAAALLSDPMHRRRLAHLASENERVERCVAALGERDMAKVRELFLQSHRSLRYDYEVSTPELDALVEIARDAHPLVAARLTGAGFGGCTVNLVPRAALRFFMREVPARLAAKLKVEPLPALEVDVGDGARRVF